MNNIHRIVFNHTTGTWVAASELAKNGGKRKVSSKTAKSLVRAALGGGVFCAISAASWAQNCDLTISGAVSQEQTCNAVNSETINVVLDPTAQMTISGAGVSAISANSQAGNIDIHAQAGSNILLHDPLARPLM